MSLSLTQEAYNSENTRLQQTKQKLEKIAPGSKVTIPAPAQEAQSGCFIATACYGSECHPSVEILREFRDEVLLKTSPGRFFVKIYYAASPWIASRLQRKRFLTNIIKDYLLQPVVSRVATLLEKLK